MMNYLKVSEWFSAVFAGETVTRQGNACQHRHRLIGFFLLLGLCFLLIAHAQASQPYQISGEMVAGGDAWIHQISADSSRVVYRADQDTDEVDELYSVSIYGGGGRQIE